MNKRRCADPAQMDWENANDKRYNDIKLYKCLSPLSSFGRLRVLSFPAANWHFERGLIERGGNLCFEFVGVELNPVVHKKALVTMNSLRHEYPRNSFTMGDRPESLLQHLKNASTGYDFIYTDWMGTWSENKEKEIHTVFKRRLLNCGGFFAFTIMLGRGSRKTNTRLKLMANHNRYGFQFDSSRDDATYVAKTLGLSNTLYELASKHNYEISLVHFSEYSSSHQPQLTFVFQSFYLSLFERPASVYRSSA